jgi:hypothetical protein
MVLKGSIPLSITEKFNIQNNQTSILSLSGLEAWQRLGFF